MDRIQRKRTKGWKMPENTFYVGRPTKWGNMYKIGRDGTAVEVVEKYEWWLTFTGRIDEIAELRGKNLACFCPLDQPCHADVLLRLAKLEGAK
jgi:hypothetical protein